jgi:YHS domain-containing protein
MSLAVGIRPVTMEKCPVCGEAIYEGEDEQYVTEYQGEQFTFCSEEHRDEFESSPGEHT